jgi:hypothetical protein
MVPLTGPRAWCNVPPVERLRTRWTAIVAALLLLLAVAGVAGATHLARPSTVGASHVQAAPGAEGQDEDANAAEDQDTDANETEDTATDTNADSPDEAGAQGEHGAAVSAVAHSDAVGGKNDNHGGAVSAVARGTHGPSAAAGTSGTSASTSHGNSASHRQDAAHQP